MSTLYVVAGVRSVGGQVLLVESEEGGQAVVDVHKELHAILQDDLTVESAVVGPKLEVVRRSETGQCNASPDGRI